jgi:guanine nucleotide-exchange factor
MMKSRGTYEIEYYLQVMVPPPDNIPEKKHVASTRTEKESGNDEISAVEEDKEEKGATLGDALSSTATTEESPASVEELQNLAGGADIKVLFRP